MLINATKKAKTMHSRRNPNLSVTATAYSQLAPSVTSATFLSPTTASRRLLSPTPPGTPGLPSLIPRHGKKQPSSYSQSRLVKRILIGTVGVAILLFLVIRQLYAYQSRPLETEDGEEYEMVEGSLPQEPSAVIVQDDRGRSKWLVSIPGKYGFPLRPEQYVEICQQSMELSKQLRMEAMNPITKRHSLSYYGKDQTYLDVQEAEEQGFLHPSKAQSRPKGFVDDEDIVAKGPMSSELKVCDRSLTYVMESTDAGFGNTLMRLWMSYGLALKEKRAFFIDDTRWPYGKYSTYFTPPPSPGCAPPPTSHMVPCPHNARHIIVSGATVKQTFGHDFNEEYEDPRKMRVQRQHKIFALLRTGYEALFKLRPDDASYVLNRTETIYAPVIADGGISIGIHVRRGDKHPYEYQYQKDYIPLDRYMDTARAIATKKRHPSTMIVASDDPQVYETPEMSGTTRAQDRIMLATKATLEAAQGKKNPWIDEITGWEGGFFRDVFFSLGQPVGNANDIMGLSNEKIPEGALRLRELVGRAYLLDLAVLSQADTVVCTVSSIGCRILAVMLGWDRAIEGGDWWNVDGAFEWKGIVW